MTASLLNGHGVGADRAALGDQLLKKKPEEAHAVVRERLIGFLHTICKEEWGFRRAEDLQLIAHFVESLHLDSKDLLWLEGTFLTGNVSDQATRGRIESIAQLGILKTMLTIHQKVFMAQERASAAEAAANTDSLTGLHNRRGLEEALRRLSSKWGTVIMLDIDHFKAINDTHGHHTGDQALQCLAEVCNTQIRNGSAEVARFGGEEFVVVLPDVTDEATARAIAERLRQAIPVHAQERLGFEMTASLGVALGALNTFDALKNQADELLYAAKRGGRNRVVTGQA